MKAVLKLGLCLLLISISSSSYTQNEQARSEFTSILNGEIFDKDNIFSKGDRESLEIEMQHFIKSTNLPIRILVVSDYFQDTILSDIKTSKNLKGVFFIVNDLLKEVQLVTGNELRQTINKSQADHMVYKMNASANKISYITEIRKAINTLLTQLIH